MNKTPQPCFTCPEEKSCKAECKLFEQWASQRGQESWLRDNEKHQRAILYKRIKLLRNSDWALSEICSELSISQGWACDIERGVYKK